jgi:hypothetical protein
LEPRSLEPEGFDKIGAFEKDERLEGFEGFERLVGLVGLEKDEGLVGLEGFEKDERLEGFEGRAIGLAAPVFTLAPCGRGWPKAG